MTTRLGHPLRGQIWFAPIRGHGEKPVLIVSNNLRNRNLESVVTTRVTSAPKPPLPTVVPLSGQDPLVGAVLCDDIIVIPKSVLRRHTGALSVATMSRVEAGLKFALGISK